VLQDLATREVIHYLAGVDLNDVLSQGRLLAADALRDRIQDAANARSLGAKIIFVGLQDIHPPTLAKSAEAYEKVVGAEETRLATILAAQADAIAQTHWRRKGVHDHKCRRRRRVQLVSSRCRSGAVHEPDSGVCRRAGGLSPAAVFAELRRRHEKRAQICLLVTNTQDVVWLDLEDKIRDDLLNLSITNSP